MPVKPCGHMPKCRNMPGGVQQLGLAACVSLQQEDVDRICHVSCTSATSRQPKMSGAQQCTRPLMGRRLKWHWFICLKPAKQANGTAVL